MIDLINKDNFWRVFPLTNGRWKLEWPTDVYSPLEYEDYDIVMNLMQSAFKFADIGTDVGFWVECPERGNYIHYFSEPYYHLKYDFAEFAFHILKKNRANIVGLCYQKESSARQLLDQLEKNYTMYLLKLEH